MIIQNFILNFLQQNTWVLIDEESKEAIVIDLGGDYKRVFDYIKEQGATLKFILNTHGHFDHINGEPLMQTDGIDIPVYMSAADEFVVQKLPKEMEGYGFEQEYPPVKVTKYIDKNSKLSFGKYDIKVLETPGHTKGGLCFIIDGKLFTGDTLFKDTIGRCDIDGGNMSDMLHSLKHCIYDLPDDTEIFPGHGENTTVGREKKKNPYLKKLTSRFL